MNKTVMIIDDEENVLRFMKIKLEAMGYPVIAVSTGKEAIETLEGMLAGKTFSILAIILDLQLHEESGFDVLEKIKRIYLKVPVIMVTGCYEENAARKAVALGALEYITKPVDFQYLMNILEMQK